MANLSGERANGQVPTGVRRAAPAHMSDGGTHRARARASSLPVTTLLAALQRPETFDQVTDAATPPILLQTHGSLVALVGARVYKIKKPVNLGFLDYSTPARRRRACLAEVALNSRLARGVYLGVAPVIMLPSGALHMGQIMAGDDVPSPDAPWENGRVADYAVVMRRLPEDATFAAHLAANTLDAPMLAMAAQRLTTFHANAAHGARVAHYGSTEAALALWQENFDQMQANVGALFAPDAFDRVRRAVSRFVSERASLFASRVRAGRIHDGHGDLRLEHIYYLADGDTAGADDGRRAAEQAARIEMVDCIEFSPRYRCADVAAEIAFPIMELDAAGRPDLGRIFADEYIQQSGDEGARELLPFYLSYRACVRAKVNALLAAQPEVSDRARRHAQQTARDLFSLADMYAASLRPRVLALVGGLSGSGKSALTGRLAHTLGWPTLSSDEVRKRLARIPVERPQADAFGQGVYTEAWTQRVYRELAQRAQAELDSGHSVIVDATFGRQAFRREMARVATEAGVRAVFLECVCPPEVALARLRARWERRVAGAGPTGDRRTGNAAPSYASDARPEIFERQLQAWQAFDAGEAPHMEHAIVDTSQPLAVAAESAQGVLSDEARQVCWLT